MGPKVIRGLKGREEAHLRRVKGGFKFIAVGFLWSFLVG